MNELEEKIASLCHLQWCTWMEYLFSKSVKLDIPINTGAYVIPKWAVDEWRRQMYTEYNNLSEEEKDSCRNEARKFIFIFKDMIRDDDNERNE